MSDRFASALLRLYPASFRERFGEEYLRLARECEPDGRSSLRFRVHLLADTARALPSEYFREQAGISDGELLPFNDSAPTFFIFGHFSPRPKALFFGAIVAALALSFAGKFSALQPPGDVPVATAYAHERDDQRPSNERSNAGADSLNAETRHRVITNALAVLEQHSADPGTAKKAAQQVLQEEEAGQFDSATTPEELARMLTTKLREATEDHDLEVLVTRRPIPERSHDQQQPAFPPAYRAETLRLNCGFEQVEVMQHNIGYIKLNAFPDASVCGESANKFLGQINNADAVIIDLRENRGGFASLVKLIAAHFFDHPVYLYSPIEDTSRESWTHSPIAGSKLTDKPLYILTSDKTMSAAEQFTYNMKALKRATIIGERTAGEAHAADFHSIGDNFYLGTVETKSINPYSKYDWNGTGIEPDVKVKASDALEAAVTLAAKSKAK